MSLLDRLAFWRTDREPDRPDLDSSEGSDVVDKSHLAEPHPAREVLGEAGWLPEAKAASPAPFHVSELECPDCGPTVIYEIEDPDEFETILSCQSCGRRDTFSQHELFFRGESL